MGEVDAVARPREEVVPAGLSFALIRWIDAVNDRVGRAASWLTLLMVIITTYDVVMRYLFRTSYVFIQEAEWHLFAILFLVVAGYTHLKGDHVRVDIFYARMSPRKRAWIDLVCGVLFLFPTAFLLIWTSIPFVINSIAVLEGSPDPGGIPGRFVLKAMIPFGFLLVGLQGVSETIKNLLRLAGKDVVIGKELPR